MTDLLARSVNFATDGRNLTGYALKWNVASRVSDGGAPYDEAFSRASFADFTDATLPLMMMHPLLPDARTSPVPLGASTFEDDGIGLVFNARVSRTQAGDEALALIADGAMSNVSLSFYARAQTKAGSLVTRSSVRPVELSLVPTGLQAHKDAAILAVRQIELIETPALNKHRRLARLL